MTQVIPQSPTDGRAPVPVIAALTAPRPDVAPPHEPPLPVPTPARFDWHLDADGVLDAIGRVYR
jgi:hypothetical protein